MVGNDRVSKLVSRADRKMESLTQREVQSSPSIDESEENDSDEEEEFELSPALLSPFAIQQNDITVNDNAAMNDADDDATRLSRRRRASKSLSTKNENNKVQELSLFHYYISVCAGQGNRVGPEEV